MSQFCHIVLLKFKPDTSDVQIQEIFHMLESLKKDDKIPGLMSYSGGKYSSPEGLNKDYTHAFTMIFNDEASRNDYFPHHEHVKVKDVIISLVDDVIAFDYAV
jgi:RecA-family ATPase